MNSARDPQISLFNNFFIKHWSYDTIHTFKNYFTTVFSVFNKINGIQTHPKTIKTENILHKQGGSTTLGVLGENFKWGIFRFKYYSNNIY